jgi:glycerate 2-kinase
MNPLRAHALEIFQAGIRAVEPAHAVRSHLTLKRGVLRVGTEDVPLPPGRVLVVGMGKAAVPMADAVEEVLEGRVAGGLVVTKTGHGGPLRRVRVAEASHPVPDVAGQDAARELARIAHNATENDLLIVVVSGGGSALLPSPVSGVTLADKGEVTRLLLASGATINELNCVRKHLSVLKGGGLARLAHPARVVALILSDVVGDPLDVIASGPTVADPTTFAEAMAILDKYGLRERAPAPVTKHLARGVAGELADTPKAGAPELSTVVNVLVGTNALAVAAAEARARALGYGTEVLSTTVVGEAREIARERAALAKELAGGAGPLPLPACVLSGGEPTVTVRGGGKGGRNQELALAAALAIEGLDGVVVLSGGTDGSDGPTDATGAVVDGRTVERARAAGLDPLRHLEENDAYPLLDATGDLVRTGPTRTNVMDLHVVLVGPAPGGVPR